MPSSTPGAAPQHAVLPGALRQHGSAMHCRRLPTHILTRTAGRLKGPRTPCENMGWVASRGSRAACQQAQKEAAAAGSQGLALGHVPQGRATAPVVRFAAQVNSQRCGWLARCHAAPPGAARQNQRLARAGSCATRCHERTGGRGGSVSTSPQPAAPLAPRAPLRGARWSLAAAPAALAARRCPRSRSSARRRRPRPLGAPPRRPPRRAAGAAAGPRAPALPRRGRQRCQQAKPRPPALPTASLLDTRKRALGGGDGLR